MEFQSKNSIFRPPRPALLGGITLLCALWACSPADMVSSPPDCPDTTYVATRDSLHREIRHRPCKTTYTVDIGDWVPGW